MKVERYMATKKKRLFLSPGYPSEDVLRQFHIQTSRAMMLDSARLRDLTEMERSWLLRAVAEEKKKLNVRKVFICLVLVLRDCVVDVKGYLSKERGVEELELGFSVLKQKFIKTPECGSPESTLSSFSWKEEKVVKEEE
ncbi:unnamed protein product [Arabis nemorensis]|uniref:Uncharacterized protein n=1 Tax=Arabis nemorensis TaxID=586526 RepID=A0A565CLE3_9BRAS|nr:unnamed protein product [Arabis nemorensis]